MIRKTGDRLVQLQLGKLLREEEQRGSERGGEIDLVRESYTGVVDEDSDLGESDLTRGGRSEGRTGL